MCMHRIFNDGRRFVSMGKTHRRIIGQHATGEKRDHPIFFAQITYNDTSLFCNAWTHTELREREGGQRGAPPPPRAVMDLGTSVGVGLGELLLGGRELVPQPLVLIHEGLELRAERIRGATMGLRQNRDLDRGNCLFCVTRCHLCIYHVIVHHI